MAFTTIKGYTPTQADADGLLPFGESGYTTLDKTQFRNTLKDVLQGRQYQNLAGVLIGGVCTASDNNVTVPAGTYIIVGGVVWYNTGAEIKSGLPDGTNYLWFCSDGEMRVTSDTTPPDYPDFTTKTACILTMGVTTAGVTVLDNSLQERARTADGTNRVIGENAGVFAPILSTFPEGQHFTIPSGAQYSVTGDFYNYATLVNFGTLYVVGEPGS